MVQQKDRPIGPANCIWHDGRWQLRHRGIHAGESLYMRAAARWSEPDDEGQQKKLGPGDWIRVRVESAEAGRVLVAYFFFQGIMFNVRLMPEHELAWEVIGIGSRVSVPESERCMECGHGRSKHDVAARTCAHRMYEGAAPCQCRGFLATLG